MKKGVSGLRSWFKGAFKHPWKTRSRGVRVSSQGSNAFDFVVKECDKDRTCMHLTQNIHYLMYNSLLFDLHPAAL
jgi:hypothetical protein